MADNGVVARFDTKIPMFALAATLIGIAGAFYGIQARVSVLEVRTADLKANDEKRTQQIDALRSEAEASRARMIQSVGELKEILIELRGNSRRLEDRLETIAPRK